MKQLLETIAEVLGVFIEFTEYVLFLNAVILPGLLSSQEVARVGELLSYRNWFRRDFLKIFHIYILESTNAYRKSWEFFSIFVVVNFYRIHPPQ